MKVVINCLSAVVLSVAAGQVHPQLIGRVLLAAGDTVAVRGNQTVRLTLGSGIQEKDVLRTGPGSNLQVRFIDDSLTSLRENSELRIDEFRFTGKEDGTERAFFRLLKGGLRTITGLVGRTNHRNYQLGSLTSTIGIRGTDISLRQCQNDCVRRDGTPERNGNFGTTNGMSSGTNVMTVMNPGAQGEFGIGQSFYDDSKSTIERLLARPDVLADPLPGRGKVAKAAGTGAERTAAGGAAQDSRAAADLPQPTTVINTLLAQQPAEFTARGGSSGVPTIAGVGALFDPLGFPNETGDGGGFFTVSNLTTTPGPADSPATTQQLLAFTLPAGFHAELGGGAFTSTGVSSGSVINETTTNALDAHWGRWTGGNLTEQDASPSPIPVSVNNQFHYLYAPLTPAEVVAAKTGSFTLFYTGFGTTPTNNLGELGSFGASPGSINFTTRQVTFGPSSFSFPSQNWSFPSHTTPLNIVAGKGAFTKDVVSGSCGGSSCSGSAVLGTTSIFAGSRGDHLIAGHQARTISGPSASAQTAKIYTCAPSC